MLPSFPRRVLVVEDEALLLMLLEATLTNAGFEVTMAADGENAIRIASATTPDLVIMDYKLGVPPDGVDLLTRLQSVVSPPPSTIVVTALTLTGDERRALEKACGGRRIPVIAKPFGTDELIAEIVACFVEAEGET
jgi:DNA-binding response OmpR family regulator